MSKSDRPSRVVKPASANVIAAATAYVIQPLERRLLLATDLTYNAGGSLFGLTTLLRSSGSQVQLVRAADNSVLTAVALSDFSGNVGIKFGGGADTLTFDPSLAGITTRRITVDAETIVVGTNRATISTRVPVSGGSTGNSGNITLRGQTIDVRSGSKLLAGVDGGFSGGDITLRVTHAPTLAESIAGYASPLLLNDRKAIISIGATTIDGRTVIIDASAATKTSWNDESTLADDIADSAIQSIGQLSTIASRGDVTVAAGGTADTETEAASLLFRDGVAGLAVGVSVDKATINSTVNGKITAAIPQGTASQAFDGRTDVSSTDHTITLRGISRAAPIERGDGFTYDSQGQPAVVGLVDGQKYVVADATTIGTPDADGTITQRVTLAKAGTLDLDATQTSAASSQTLGKDAISTFNRTAVSADANNVLSIDPAALTTLLGNGQSVQYTGPNSPVSEKNIAATFARSASGDTITIPNHGFVTGDLLNYQTDPAKSTTQPVYGYDPANPNTPVLLGQADLPDAPVDGLQDGEAYYVTVVDANTVLLSESSVAARDAVAIPIAPAAGTGAQALVAPEAGRGVNVTAGLAATNGATAGVELSDGEQPLVHLLADSTTNAENLLGGFVQAPGLLSSFRSPLNVTPREDVEISVGLGYSSNKNYAHAIVSPNAVIDARGQTTVHSPKSTIRPAATAPRTRSTQSRRSKTTAWTA